MCLYREEKIDPERQKGNSSPSLLMYSKPLFFSCNKSIFEGTESSIAHNTMAKKWKVFWFSERPLFIPFSNSLGAKSVVKFHKNASSKATKNIRSNIVSWNVELRQRGKKKYFQKPCAW